MAEIGRHWLTLKSSGGGLLQNRRGRLLQYGCGGLIDIGEFRSRTRDTPRKVVSRDKCRAQEWLVRVHAGVDDSYNAGSGGVVTARRTCNQSQRRLLHIANPGLRAVKLDQVTVRDWCLSRRCSRGGWAVLQGALGDVRLAVELEILDVGVALHPLLQQV